MLQGLRKTDHHANILGDIIESVNGKEVTNNNDLFKILDLCKEGDKLESIDTAPEVPHPRPTRLPACRTASAFFFFFFSDSSRLGSIRADAARFVPNRLQFALNRADLAKIGPYRPYRVVSAGGRYGRNRPEKGQNMPEIRRKLPKSALNMVGKSETCILLSFFVNQGVVCVF